MATAPKAAALRKRQAIDKAGKSMLLWVTIASIAVSFLLVASQFLYQEFAYKKQILDAKNKADTTLTQNLENIEELKAAFGPLDAGTNPNVNSKTVLDALPRELDTSAFGTSLQNVIAPRSGVSLDSVEIEDIAIDDESEEGGEVAGADPTPQEIKVSMTVAGNYEQLSNFVRDLELTIRPIKIDIMSITGSDADTRANIEMTTYYQPTKKVQITKEELTR